MNKKILMSVAAAATIATTFVGCGSDNNAATGSTIAVVPADGYIYGMTGGTIGDDNLTQTVAMGATASFTGGAHIPAPGVSIPNNATLSVIVPAAADTNDTQIMATPITSMIAAAVAAGETKANAEKKVASIFNVDPSDATAVAALVKADPVAAVSEGSMNAAQRAAVAQIFVMMDQLSAAGATGLTNALANVVSKGSTSVVAPQTTAQINAAVSDEISGIDANVTAAIAAVATKVAAAAAAGGEAAVNAALKSAYDMTTAIQAGTSAGDLNTSFDLNVTAANTAIQTAITGSGVPYLDYNNTDTDISLNDTNASGHNAITNATLTLMFENEGNANLTYAVRLEDINLTESSNVYTYSIANNTNVTWYATDTDGSGTASGTTDAEDNASTSSTLENVISSDMLDANSTLTWLWNKANLDINVSAGGYDVNVNGNWSVNSVLSLDDNTSTKVPLYIKGADNNYTTAPAYTIEVGSEKDSGAKVFTGSITGNSPSID